MLNILVVDDKKLIRRGVKAIIYSSDLQVGQVFECSNGLDALKLLETEPVDLVITDIRMPEMDGICLMQKAQCMGHMPKFIVVSGYDDFKYAKESINYGAKAYILKPLDRSELVDTIRRVTEEISREKLQEQNEEQINTIAKRLQEDEFRLILGGIQSESVERLSDSGFVFRGKQFYISLITKRNGVKHEADTWQSRLKIEINTFFSLINANFISFEMGKTLLLIIDDPIFLTELLEHICKDTDKFVAALSNICPEIERVREYFLQAQDALKYSLLHTDVNIIYYSDIELLKNEFTIPFDTIRKIGQMIGTERTTSVDEMISGLFNRNIVLSNRIDYVEGIAASFFEMLKGISGVQKDDWSDEKGKMEALSSIYNFDNIREYLMALKGYINNLNGYVLSMRNAYREKNEIEKAIDFMNANYEKDISLTTVSNHVSLNYSYFSHAFKEQTGLSFVEFLRKLRINKSMELLAGTNLKIFEIAERTGFVNYKHFARTFRELVGIPPVEYREKALMQNANKITPYRQTSNT